MSVKVGRAISVGPTTDVAAALATPLERRGFTVAVSTSPDDCLDRIDDEVTCVISTEDLDGTDGITLLRTVRAAYPRLPFVLVARDGDETVASEAIQAGVSDYVVVNGGNMPDFGPRVEDAIERAGRRGQGTAETSAGESQTAELLAEMSEIMTARSLSLQEQVSSLLELLGETVGADVATVSSTADGQTALEAATTVAGGKAHRDEIAPVADHPACKHVIETGEPLVRKDGASAPSTSPTLVCDGTAFLGAPVTVEGSVTGAVCIFSMDSRRTAVPDWLEPVVAFLASWVGYRIEHEHCADQLAALDTAVPDVGFVVDTDGQYRRCLDSGGPADISGADSADVVGRTLHEVMPRDTADSILAAIRRASRTGRLQSLQYTLRAPTGTRWFEGRISPIGSSASGSDTALLLARDVTEQRQRIEHLEQLRRNVSDVVWMRSAETDAIEFISDSYEDVWGRPADSLRAEPLSFIDAIHPADRERVATAIDAQRRNPDAYEETYRVKQPDGEIRWVTDSASGIYEDGTLKRIVGIAKDITERKTRENALERNRNELLKLNRLNTLTREVIHALQDAKTRDGIEAAVCDGLTGSDLYQTAWIGTNQRTATGEPKVDPQAASGVDTAYLEGIPGKDGPAKAALATGTVQVLNDLATSDAFPDSRRDIAQQHNHHSLATIPLTTGETTYGVLVVYTPAEKTIGDAEQEILADLGQSIALAIQRVHSQRSLTATSVIELQLRIERTDGADILPPEWESKLRFDQHVPTAGGTSLQYYTIHGTDRSTLCDHLVETGFAESCTVVREADGSGENQALLEVGTADANRNPIDVLIDQGASITQAWAGDGEIQLTAEVAPESDVRAIVAAVQNRSRTVELVSKRLVNRPMSSVPEIIDRVSNRLSTKQKAALGAAYSRGYYEWPRESTAEELAETMGIASSTLHYHLRNAIQELLTAYYERDCGFDQDTAAIET